jgi:hypothetical protein
MAGNGSCRVYGGDGRGVCDVHSGGRRAAQITGGDVEQRLVSALSVCRDQLHTKLGLCLLCGSGVMAGSLCVRDFVATMAWKRGRNARADGGEAGYLNDL